MPKRLSKVINRWLDGAILIEAAKGELEKVKMSVLWGEKKKKRDATIQGAGGRKKKKKVYPAVRERETGI